MFSIKGAHKDIIDRIVNNKKDPVFGLREVTLELESASRESIIAALQSTTSFKFETYSGDFDDSVDVNLVTYREMTEEEKTEVIESNHRSVQYNMRKLQEACDRTTENNEQIKSYISRHNLDIVLK